MEEEAKTRGDAGREPMRRTSQEPAKTGPYYVKGIVWDYKELVKIAEEGVEK